MQALAYLRAARRQNGYSPSVRELAGYLECSPAAAHKVLRSLERKRLVSHDERASRSWRPTEAGIELLERPA